MTAPVPDARLLTVGHSNHLLEEFLGLLRRHGVTAVADVRSDPASRYRPEYDRGVLAGVLPARGVRYVFLGRELGARRVEPECHAGGRVRYDLVAASPLFRRGLARVRHGVRDYRVALMCAEGEPLACHRTILVCRHLRGSAGPIAHIRPDGTLEPHAEAETRLLELCGLPPRDLFGSREELLDVAYEMQGERLAYTPPAAAEGAA